jgi:DtxR family Mn-dependent transcriptional regulator
MKIWKQFEENEITHSAAHHLMAVKEIRDRQGYARVSDVARDLGITTGSASTNLKGLKVRGLIDEDPNRFLVLTAEGERLVAGVFERRRVMFSLLSQIIGVPGEQAEIDACKVEHLLSEETLEAMKRYVVSQGGTFDVLPAGLHRHVAERVMDSDETGPN